MSSCFCFAFFTQADSTRLIENEAFSSNANNSPVMTTHSPSFPPDHYILAVQVRTVVHPLLQKRSSLVSPPLKGAQRSLTWTQSDSKRISCFQMIHIHLCVSVTEPAHLTALFPLRARQAGFILCKNSACHFRNDRLDDDTLLETTGCTLNDQFYIFRGRVWGFAMECRVRKK